MCLLVWNIGRCGSGCWGAAATGLVGVLVVGCLGVSGWVEVLVTSDLLGSGDPFQKAVEWPLFFNVNFTKGFRFPPKVAAC